MGVLEELREALDGAKVPALTEKHTTFSCEACRRILAIVDLTDGTVRVPRTGIFVNFHGAELGRMTFACPACEQPNVLNAVDIAKLRRKLGHPAAA